MTSLSCKISKVIYGVIWGHFMLYKGSFRVILWYIWGHLGSCCGMYIWGQLGCEIHSIVISCLSCTGIGNNKFLFKDFFFAPLLTRINMVGWLTSLCKPWSIVIDQWKQDSKISLTKEVRERKAGRTHALTNPLSTLPFHKDFRTRTN